jgi:transposase-like protein
MQRDDEPEGHDYESPGADILCEMIGYAAERLMDIGALTGAGFGEKSAELLSLRNRHHDRNWQARAGTVNLRIPKLQTGRYFPGFLEPR